MAHFNLGRHAYRFGHFARALEPFAYFLYDRALVANRQPPELSPMTSALPLLLVLQALVFKDHGKEVKSLSQDEVTALAAPAALTTYETLEAKENRYKALPLSALLTKVYGDRWKKADEVLVTCADGYQPS